MSSTRHGSVGGAVLGVLLGALGIVAVGSATAGEADTVQSVPADPAAEREASRAKLVAVIEKAIDDCEHGIGAELTGKTAPAAGPQRMGTPARTIKLDTDNYPMQEMMEGQQAILIVSYLVDGLGNPRFVHVDRQIASNIKFNGFVPRAIAMIRTGKFAAATVQGQPIASWVRSKVKFTIDSAGRMGTILSDEALDRYVKKAREGDLKSQLLVSYADSIAHDEVAIPTGEQHHFLAVSASVGERSALIRLAQLLGQPSCKPPAEVEDYIRRQALSGKSDLELLQATRLLDRKDEQHYPEVGAMLHGAANANDSFVQLWAAGILATTPIESLRDPVAALATAKAVPLKGDPDAGELLAAALAANGQYQEAVREETGAIEAARKLHWKDDFMQQRLAKYTAGEPWIGYLCDCDRLVAGGGL